MSSQQLQNMDENDEEEDHHHQQMRRSRLLAEFDGALAMIPGEMKPELVEVTEKKVAATAAAAASLYADSDAADEPLSGRFKLAFLRHENCGGAFAAVLRYCMYWKARKEIFRERFDRPLTSGGADGAFTEEELGLLSSGYLTLLPEPDPEGSPVVFVNYCLAQVQSLEAQVRAGMVKKHFFYLCQKACCSRELDEAREDRGVVFLFVVSDNRLVPEINDLVQTVKKALPLEVNKIYVVAPNSSSSELDASLAALVQEEFVTVYGDRPTQIGSVLVDTHGFRVEALPPAVGGAWSNNEDLAIAPATAAAREPSPPPPEALATAPPHPGSSTVAAAAASTSFPIKLSPDAALERIPHGAAADYLEAKKRVPVIVDHESPFSMFLACEVADSTKNSKSKDGAAAAATLRLISYWRSRKEVFGDRAFLPLNISGQGALEQEDLGILMEGLLFLLPDDTIGRPVVCVNMAHRDPRRHPIPSITRIWFYLLHVAAAEHKKAQSDGLVCLYIPPSKAQQEDMSIEEEKGHHMTCASSFDDFDFSPLPVRISMIHLLLPEQPTSWTSTLEEQIPSCLPLVGKLKRSRIGVHSVGAGHSILGRLRAYGLESAGLPVGIGGTWDPDTDLKAWVAKRGASEGVELNKLVTSHSENVYGVEEPESTEEISDAPVSDDEAIDEAVNSKEKYFSCINNGLDAFTETSDIMAKGLSELEEALSLLPFEDKAELLQARDEIPELAEKEAPPIRFLRFENYNTWAAARRLAAYWKKRKELFGARAFFPMNLSGEGTLTREDVIILCSGYMAMLPYDRSGRTVICYDHQRMTSKSTEVRLRLAFYFWSVMGENPMTQTEGAKVLIILRTTKSDKAAQTVSNMVMETLPVRFESLHICNCPTEPERTTFLDSLVPIMLRIIGLLKKKTTVHVASTKEELVEKLSKHDFRPECIPECLGGSWSYDMFPHWLELRTRYEWDLPPVGGKDPLIPHVPEYTVKPRSLLSNAEKVERKRRLNVLNSRRKRDRVRVEVSVFNAQVKHLRQQNRELRLEQQRLEGFLEKANTVVAIDAALKPSSKPSPPALDLSLQSVASLGDPQVARQTQLSRGFEPFLRRQDFQASLIRHQQPSTTGTSGSASCVQSHLQERLIEEMLRERARDALLREQAAAMAASSAEINASRALPRTDQLPVQLQRHHQQQILGTNGVDDHRQRSLLPAAGLHSQNQQGLLPSQLHLLPMGATSAAILLQQQQQQQQQRQAMRMMSPQQGGLPHQNHNQQRQQHLLSGGFVLPTSFGGASPAALGSNGGGAAAGRRLYPQSPASSSSLSGTKRGRGPPY